MSDGIGLNVSVVIFTSPDKSTVPFHSSSDHIIDQAVLISDASGFKFIFEFVLKYFLKNIFKTTVISFHDGVFGRKVKRPTFIKSSVHTRSCKSKNRRFNIVHAHCNTFFLEIINLPRSRITAVLWRKGHGEFTLSSNHRIGGFVLIAKSVPSDTYRFGPSLNVTGNVF